MKTRAWILSQKLKTNHEEMGVHGQSLSTDSVEVPLKRGMLTEMVRGKSGGAQIHSLG